MNELREYIEKELDMVGVSDGVLYWAITECPELERTISTVHRWFIEVDVVVKIGEKYIRYVDEMTTGDDEHFRDYKQLIDDLIELKPVERVITTYIPI